MNILSLEYVPVQVSAKKLGAVYDPTGDEVQFAFKPPRVKPVSSDWTDGVWETDTAGSTTVYIAKILVGPGGTVTLAAGEWVVWLKIFDSPEVPVLQTGTLTIENT